VFGLTFNLVPIEQYLGIPMSLNMGTLWNIFWLCVPMLLLASALQMVVAAFTRSFKEAQTYLSFMPLVAGLPSMFAGFLSVKSSFETMLIPTFGQALLINQLLRGEVVVESNVIISTVATLVAAVLCTLLAVRLYQREQVLFGKK
jgi:sodium transport system permease protein